MLKVSTGLPEVGVIDFTFIESLVFKKFFDVKYVIYQQLLRRIASSSPHPSWP